MESDIWRLQLAHVLRGSPGGQSSSSGFALGLGLRRQGTAFQPQKYLSGSGNSYHRQTLNLINSGTSGLISNQLLQSIPFKVQRRTNNCNLLSERLFGYLSPFRKTWPVVSCSGTPLYRVRLSTNTWSWFPSAWVSFTGSHPASMRRYTRPRPSQPLHLQPTSH